MSLSLLYCYYFLGVPLICCRSCRFTIFFLSQFVCLLYHFECAFITEAKGAVCGLWFVIAVICCFKNWYSFVLFCCELTPVVNYLRFFVACSFYASRLFSGIPAVCVCVCVCFFFFFLNIYFLGMYRYRSELVLVEQNRSIIPFVNNWEHKCLLHVHCIFICTVYILFI